MFNVKLATLYILHFFLSVQVLQADVIKPDDVIVPGHICVGQDCSTALDGGGNILMDFEDNTLTFRENNNSVRFVDSTADNVLGQSWRIGVNSPQNFGRDYFQFEARSITQDSVALSEGLTPLYDCSVATNLGVLPPVIGTIPFGSPIVSPTAQSIADGMGQFFWTCETEMDFTTKALLSLGNGTESNATLGKDSEPVADAVSIGNPTVLRHLKWVATGLASSDLLIKKMLDDYSLLPSQTAQIDLLFQQLTELENQIVEIEDEVFPKSSGSGSIGWRTIIFILLIFALGRVYTSHK